MAISAMQPYKTGMVQLAPNLFTYLQYNGTWGQANAGIIVGKDYAIVVDTFMLKHMNDSLMKSLRESTIKPVRYLVNTHSHTDHTYGNDRFKESSIIAHVKCLEEMEERAVLNEKLRKNKSMWPPRAAWMTPEVEEERYNTIVTMPNVTITGNMTLQQDDTIVELLHYGPAHTNGDVSVYLPKQEVAFIGDLGFFYCTPIANNSVSNFIVSLDKLLALSATTYVPGHGPVGTKEAVKESREYLEFLMDEAKKGVKAGQKAEQHAKHIKLGAFEKWGESERLTNNLKTAYRDLGANTLA